MSQPNSQPSTGVAGRAAALPGLLAALTTRPLIGVPVGHTVPFDSLLSIVQMPPGITVATVGVDRGDNAALLAAGILGVKDHDIRSRLDRRRRDEQQEVLAANTSLRSELDLQVE
jgi:5-(carboxyamino)imidazole ribonucleotide mutase